MDHLAYRLAKASAWLVAIIWLASGGFALANGLSWPGALFLCSGLSLLIWNVLFLPAVNIGREIRPFYPALVVYEDAPLGYFLSNLLPLISNIALVSACVLLIRHA